MVGYNLDQFGYIMEVGEDEHLLNYEGTAGTFVTDDTPLGRVMVAKELCLFLFLGLLGGRFPVKQLQVLHVCDLYHFDKQCFSFMLSGPTKYGFPWSRTYL